MERKTLKKYIHSLYFRKSSKGQRSRSPIISRRMHSWLVCKREKKLMSSSGAWKGIGKLWGHRRTHTYFANISTRQPFHSQNGWQRGKETRGGGRRIGGGNTLVLWLMQPIFYCHLDESLAKRDKRQNVPSHLFSTFTEKNASWRRLRKLQATHGKRAEAQR